MRLLIAYVAGFCLVASSVLAQGYTPPDIRNLQQKAEAGDVTAQMVLAGLYAQGSYNPTSGKLDIAPDAARSLYWYEKAADQGNERAMDQVCSSRRSGSLADWDKALKACRRAALDGEESSAQSNYLNMGKAYELGMEGQPVDAAKAMTIYNELADANYLPAIETLIPIYASGTLVAKDAERTVALIQKAIYFRPEVYLLPLARHFETGWGNRTDPLESYRLYAAAARLGVPQAIEWIANHPAMTPDMLAQNYLPKAQMPEKFRLFDEERFLGRGLGYPEKALDAEIQGEVTIECHISPKGHTENCLVVDENPPGYGFGKVTLMGIGKLGLSIAGVDQMRPYAGKLFRFPVRYTLG